MTPQSAQTEIKHVRIGEIRTATTGILKATLGSCVGIALINRRTGVCGLAHCFLPFDPQGKPSPNARYADQAAANLLRKVAPETEDRKDLRAFITGGGRLLSTGPDSRLQVGDLNVKSVRDSLYQLGIKFTEVELGTAKACNGILDCDLRTFASEKIDQHEFQADPLDQQEDRWNKQ